MTWHLESQTAQRQAAQAEQDRKCDQPCCGVTEHIDRLAAADESARSAQPAGKIITRQSPSPW